MICELCVRELNSLAYNAYFAVHRLRRRDRRVSSASAVRISHKTSARTNRRALEDSIYRLNIAERQHSKTSCRQRLRSASPSPLHDPASPAT